MEKIIFVDAWNTFVTESGKNDAMQEILDSFPNKKLILTNATPEKQKELGIVDMPYEVFTLCNNPNKSNPEYYTILLHKFNLDPSQVIYFEHNLDAIKSAESCGIKTYHYDKDRNDLESLKVFLERNI
ncbi:HAD-IA family hydrolase [Candidatus Woesearchaeota archaeon]|nr:HAD-IA family hydrolase [Candidatus Woesearchaeota archaeon]